MTPNPYIFAAEIDGTPYLLPFGQGIADHLRGIRTNESGRLLWEGLCRGEDRPALLRRLCDFYEMDPEEEEILYEDLDVFLNLLKNNGLLKEDDAAEKAFVSSSASDSSCRLAQIGPLTLALRIPDAVFDLYFSSFEAPLEKALSPGSADLCLEFLSGRPMRYSAGEILARNEEMLIADTGEEYLFLPQQGNYVHELRVSKDASHALLYGRFQGSEEACLEEIFHMIRFAFLMTAQQHDLCVVHSASLLHQGKAWLFSGHSGAGKSTHTRLWQENFNAPLLNGDLNLLGMEKGQPMCYGLPWCGTSEISTVQNYPLGGVVFLRQAPFNRVSPLSPDQEALSLTQRMITPAWTREQAQKNLELAERLTAKIRIFQLECTKDPEAAEVMRRAIEG